MRRVVQRVEAERPKASPRPGALLKAEADMEAAPPGQFGLPLPLQPLQKDRAGWWPGAEEEEGRNPPLPPSLPPAAAAGGTTWKPAFARHIWRWDTAPRCAGGGKGAVWGPTREPQTLRGLVGGEGRQRGSLPRPISRVN